MVGAHLVDCDDCVVPLLPSKKADLADKKPWQWRFCDFFVRLGRSPFATVFSTWDDPQKGPDLLNRLRFPKDVSLCPRRWAPSTNNNHVGAHTSTYFGVEKNSCYPCTRPLKGRMTPFITSRRDPSCRKGTTYNDPVQSCLYRTIKNILKLETINPRLKTGLDS